MSNESRSSQGGGTGRIILWIFLALFLAVLAYLTIFLAVPNNPLYSNRAAYGISKYQFLEECHEAFDRELNVAGGLGEQIRAVRQLPESAELYGTPALPSKELVSGIQVLQINAAGQIDPTSQTRSWAMGVPMLVKAHGAGEDQENLDIQLGMQCVYNPAAKEVVVLVQ